MKIKRFRAAMVALTAAGLALGVAAPANAHTVTWPGICSATASGSANTATTRMNNGIGNCAPGVRASWRPQGSPISMDPLWTPINWGNVGSASVSVTTQPHRVSQTAHLR